MPSKREIVEQLRRDELLDVVDHFNLEPPDRRGKDGLVDTVASSRKATLAEVLAGLTRTRLKKLCRAFGIDDSGREKAVIAARLTGGTPSMAKETRDPTPRTSPTKKKTTTTASTATMKTKKTSSNTNGNGSNGLSRGRKLTLAQLERHLFGAADILRGKMDASEFKEYIFGMLFLKRCSDEFEARREEIIEEQLSRGRSRKDAEKRADSPAFYSERFFVPDKARWVTIRDELHHNIGDGLNTALAALEETNTGLEGVLKHIDFVKGRGNLKDKELRKFIDHFNRFRLRNDDFEFPDLLGAAYEYLIGEFADSAGKKGGEFYTPRAVVRMMVRLAEPQESMKVYDPCSGSGGMLILSREHLTERGDNPRNLALYGQESNVGVWSISKMNMILHGIQDADLYNGDTLAEPLHTEGGELMRFDRVITNPPFSQNYDQSGIPFPERFRFGWCPEKGKKADLMFVQHMASVLRPGGLVATVMPHGVLFRGGAEKEIRAGFIKEDMLEAVIGLAPNLFYGTGIPACVLIIRAPGGKPKTRRGKVLFINADAELRAGRAQNYLDPEHIEKIVNAYQRFEEIPSFAAVVSHAELAENDYNLNIRRYADNTPPFEPHDVKAHLQGGVPRVEVMAAKDLLLDHGVDPTSLFVDWDRDYLEFVPEIAAKADIKTRIESHLGLVKKEVVVDEAFADWWGQIRGDLATLPDTQTLVELRADLLQTFERELLPLMLLDRFKVAGVVASWWGEAQFDLQTLAARGFAGQIDSWLTTLKTEVEDDDKKSKVDPTDDRLVQALMEDRLAEIGETQQRIVALEADKVAFEAGEDDDSESADEDEDEKTNVAKELNAELKRLKASIRDDQKRLKKLNGTFRTKGSIEWMEKKGENTTVAKKERVELSERVLPVETKMEEIAERLAPYNATKKELTETKKHLKSLLSGVVADLEKKIAGLSPNEQQELVLGFLRDDLKAQLDRAITAHRQTVVSVVERWWNKYRVTLRDIEAERDAAKAKLEGFLKELGYG